MTDGHRRRRGRRSDEAHPRRIQRFVEPCLLLLLHCNEAHGYELIEGLKPFGFEQNPVDLSSVYRMLRGLEEQGFVTSRWETDSGGPARRLYQITEEGDRYLAWWVDDLRETDRVLHYFLETYDSHMEVHQ
jgi:poly-beta-hydroxybutyrate-responsive repressor